jgi:thymidylate synthase ThyX
MSPERQVYLLDPMDLPPETIAVAFARTSRSPESFRQIAAELTEEKSTEFHEKWVVGYGHASVAEHAVLHIAVENLSRLAVECLESNRLASYTEKSTRYQKWGLEDFFIPPELNGHRLCDMYVNTIRQLFETYQQSLKPVRAAIALRKPRKEGESESAFDRRIRSDYVDVCRFLLPAASLANVGMTINARALEHALRKMFSHPLAEVRQIGLEMKRVAEKRLPTLIKYVGQVPYLEETAARLGQKAAGLAWTPGEEGDWCRLVDFDPGGEERVLAAALYRFGAFSYERALDYVRCAPLAERAALADDLMGARGPHDIPLRELELANYTFDLTLDQGGYFELKRHRMMTQTPQPLNTLLGYALPRAVVEAGMEAPYHAAMEAADRAYRALAEELPAAASYLVPNGYNRRVLLHLNLRSAIHLVSLRSADNAHFSMRRATQRMAEDIRAASPLLGGYLLTNPGETWQQVDAEHFRAGQVYPGPV